MESVYGDAARPSPGRARRGELSDALGRLLERVPRVVRFVAVGGVCAALQLLALSALGRLGVELHAANTVAFLLSTQANFALSSVVTGTIAVGGRSCAEAEPTIPAAANHRTVHAETKRHTRERHTMAR